MAITRIVSGGQTGVDRAALDVAMKHGIPCGGWCPLGRRAEDGAIPDQYPLIETPSRRYAQRTRRNVRDSDGTLILNPGGERTMAGGSALTAQIAERLARPCLIVDPRDDATLPRTHEWLGLHAIAVLNLAGPRESHAPGIHAAAGAFLGSLLRDVVSR